MKKRYIKAIIAFLWLLPFNMLFGLAVLPMIPWIRFRGVSPVGGLVFMVSGPIKRFFVKHVIQAMCLGSWQLYAFLNADLVKHEDRHLRDECRFHILYFIIYGIDYLVNLALYRDAHKAYLEVIWEIAARRAAKKVG